MATHFLCFTEAADSQSYRPLQAPVVNMHLRLVTPDIEKQTVSRNPNGRKPNAELRTREHLTPAEVDLLIAAAKANRHGHRDATMILIAYRHGLRVSELCALEWSRIDFEGSNLHVRRAKRGTPSTHPLTGIELRALRRLKRETGVNRYVFVSERGAPFATPGFARLLERAAVKAGLTIKVHPHMLRHACGFKLANQGVDTRSLQGFLGHRNIQHTVRYTELAPDRFKDFWHD